MIGSEQSLESIIHSLIFVFYKNNELGNGGMDIYYSCRELKFLSEHSSQTVYNCLPFQTQVSRCL